MGTAHSLLPHATSSHQQPTDPCHQHQQQQLPRLLLAYASYAKLQTSLAHSWTAVYYTRLGSRPGTHTPAYL
jgi:hypothetical protein